jgi:hypothetical protein
MNFVAGFLNSSFDHLRGSTAFENPKEVKGVHDEVIEWQRSGEFVVWVFCLIDLFPTIQ